MCYSVTFCAARMNTVYVAASIRSVVQIVHPQFFVL